MPSQRSSALDDALIASLRRLIRMNVDARDLHRYAAEHAEGPPLSKLLRELAEERIAQAGELRAFVARNGGDARVPGGASPIASSLELAGDPGAIVTACAGAEDAVAAAYGDLRQATLPADVDEILRRHSEAVRAARDRLRAMTGRAD